MKNRLFNQAKKGFKGKFLALGLLFAALSLSAAVEANFAQAKKRKPATAVTKKTAAVKKSTVLPDSNLPKVTQIDLPALQNLLKREAGENARPLLINFWATWCDPCREEFPDLVEIDGEYKGKIDFITISLDELSEINRDVPKFLAQMKAEMPAYLLKTPDEEAAISTVAKDWQGGLPFTILFSAKGETVFTRQGKIKPEVLRAELEKTLTPQQPAAAVINAQPDAVSSPVALRQTESFPSPNEFTAEKGKTDARKDIAAGKLTIKLFGLTALPSRKLEKSMKKYGVEIISIGCLVPSGFADYAKAYNEVSIAEIKRKFGAKALNELEIN